LVSSKTKTTAKLLVKEKQTKFVIFTREQKHLPAQITKGCHYKDRN